MVVLCYGMDGAQLDEYEVRLKEVFDGFDGSGSGSLCQEELSDLCQALHLEEAAPALLRELVQEGNLSDRVPFEQFKDALILVLSTTLGGHPSSEENSQEPDSSEVNPKFVKDGKRYGRRSLPEFGESIEGFAEVSETEPAAPEENPQNTPTWDGCEPWKTSTQYSEEYEAEGQLRLWNPDDPGTPRGGQPPSPDWLEERLGAVCEELGVSRHGCASCRQLISMCEQLGLELQGLDDVFTNLDPDRMMSVQDFISGVLRNGTPPTPSASTPYRQLKRHLSTQPFDESGRRTATPSAMTSTIALRLFSGLDDGSGYTTAERLLDAWQEEGIDNCHEILQVQGWEQGNGAPTEEQLDPLQALDFSLDGKVNLSELTIALENELQITKNGIHQAVLASFKSEIRHLLERVDREMREKGKLRSDLDKADRLKTQMATEMDEHHLAIERLNDSNLRKLEQEYRDRLSAVKAELTRDRDQIQQQASKQRSELEREVEKVKEEELYLRDRLSLAHKENMRLEAELLEITEKLVESENLASKLQSNLDNILQEKFGDLDPGSAEFFLQEERFKRMRSECEQQCRELQDRIDELQAELEEYSALGRTSRPSLGLSLTEEFDSKSGVGVESDLGLGLEEGHPFNMSLEAEMLVEQLKDQHQQDMASVRAELQSKVSEHEQQVEELKAGHAQEQRALEQRCREEVGRVQNQVHELQSQLETLEKECERAERLHIEERAELERRRGEEKSQAQARASELQVRVEALESERERGEEERRELERRHVEEQARLEETLQEERERKRAELEEREEELAELFEQEQCSLEKRHLEALEDLTLKHSEERERLTGRLQSLEQEILEERSEARRLAEENLSLKREISTLKEDGGFSQLKLKDLGDTQEEVLRKVEQFKKEKMAALKAAENLKKQVLELRSRGQQLESENAELAQKSGRNAEDLVELNRRMCEVLRHHEIRENSRRHHREELERERAALSTELSQERSKMAACMSTLESELSRVEEKSRVLEQEKALLSQELSAMKEKLSGSSDLKKELLGVVCKNEKLQKEKETLSEELNRCVDKVAKIGVLENQLAQLRQDRQAVEQHAQTLRSQLSASLDKVHSLEEAVQSVNLQMARLKSDLRVTQQEKEALKQEVMSLHKQLQNASDKNHLSQCCVNACEDDLRESQTLTVCLCLSDQNQVLDLAVQSTGYQNQQKKLYWDELARLVEQEQQLLRQENERLQKEVQNTKGDLNHCREKIRQLEAMILTLKQQKQQGQSSLVKAVEQEKSSLKRELEQLHRELLAANCRVSELSDCKRDLESLKVENEALRSRQARLESQTLCEQLGGLVPREQLVQAQHRLLQGERRGQHRPEDLGGRVPDIHMQQEGDVLLRMEERMRNVEQNLRNVKLLLQEKVSQLKDQLHRNTKADEMIKDLYVENSQLLKALEMTENRQKVTEKKNYLLEEKISSLNKIVRDLSPSPLTAVPYHLTRS
ncbi:ninein-like isoform X8 [Acipenser ruthenus]|uniref:ninein-like isoform X8 n=1 Tax=Acipenser ruthenus TaxID=7906 RepID=UPI0027426A59|nr:ninein-like isoform X8 [Acipenser ruthenus]